jgi:hypothetical protein
MALPQVTVNVTGAITRPALNKDGVTGFLFYNDNIADLSTLTSSNRVVKFTNLSTIEATGITSTSTNFKDEYYYLSEFFANGGKEVWIGIFDLPASSYDFTELDTMKDKSQGEIRIYAIPVGSKDFDSTDILLIDSIVSGYEDEKKPAIAVYSGDVGNITLASFEDLRSLSANAVNTGAVIGQDLNNRPSDVTTYSLPNIGAFVGALASAKVSENVLNVGKYNYSVGSSMNEVALRITSDAVANTLVPIDEINNSDLDSLNDKGYIFWRYLPNLPGSYLSNDHNCAAITGTFNSLHIVRVRNKVIRELDRSLSSLIGASLLFNADGTLRVASAKVYENKAYDVLNPMIENGEISAVDVYVDRTLNVLSTKIVTLYVTIVPVESSDNITVNVTFAASI